MVQKQKWTLEMSRLGRDYRGTLIKSKSSFPQRGKSPSPLCSAASPPLLRLPSHVPDIASEHRSCYNSYMALPCESCQGIKELSCTSGYQKSWRNTGFQYIIARGTFSLEPNCYFAFLRIFHKLKYIETQLCATNSDNHWWCWLVHSFTWLCFNQHFSFTQFTDIVNLLF
jgi:hypothetical protein